MEPFLFRNPVESLRLLNCRFQGSFGSSGNQHGIKFGSTAASVISRCCIYDVGGNGINVDTGVVNSATQHHIINCTIDNAKVHGIFCQNSGTPAMTVIENCYIANSGTSGSGYGINGGSGYAIPVNCRIRDSFTSDFFGMGRYMSIKGHKVFVSE